MTGIRSNDLGMLFYPIAGFKSQEEMTFRKNYAINSFPAKVSVLFCSPYNELKILP
jgi:hypothetical protein